MSRFDRGPCKLFDSEKKLRKRRWPDPMVYYLRMLGTVHSASGFTTAGKLLSLLSTSLFANRHSLLRLT